jgi:hypothetical protein
VQTGGGDPGGRGSGGMAKGQVFWHGVARTAEGRGSWCVGLEQSCGLGQPEGRRAGQKGSAALQTYPARIWQSGCSFIRSWCGEFGSPWSFTSVRRVSSFSAGSLGQLTRSAALCPSPSWISPIAFEFRQFPCLKYFISQYLCNI